MNKKRLLAIDLILAFVFLSGMLLFYEMKPDFFDLLLCSFCHGICSNRESRSVLSHEAKQVSHNRPEFTCGAVACDSTPGHPFMQPAIEEKVINQT